MVSNLDQMLDGSTVFEEWFVEESAWWYALRDALEAGVGNSNQLFADTRLGEEDGDIVTLNIRGTARLFEKGVLEFQDPEPLTTTIDGQEVSEDVNISFLRGDDDVFTQTPTDAPVLLTGGRGADMLTGSQSDDIIAGNKGDDSIFGLGGDDFVKGGAGNDRIEGGDGNDLLNGDYSDSVRHNDRQGDQEWNDDLFGGRGNDILMGNQGDDRLVGAPMMTCSMAGWATMSSCARAALMPSTAVMGQTHSSSTTGTPV
ncbi:MAG: calcium-binding protein [Pseudomonadota bacterium]